MMLCDMPAMLTPDKCQILFPSAPSHPANISQVVLAAKCDSLREALDRGTFKTSSLARQLIAFLFRYTALELILGFSERFC